MGTQARSLVFRGQALAQMTVGPDPQVFAFRAKCTAWVDGDNTRKRRHLTEEIVVSTGIPESG